MKDLYQALGIPKEASMQEIKQAYRKLSLHAHPDHGGSNEQMQLLNEAYAILSDPGQRHNFDANWDTVQTAEMDTESPVEVSDHLQAGNILPYSHAFRNEHNTLVEQYLKVPLESIAPQQKKQAFASNIYRLTNPVGSSQHEYYSDIFALLQAKRNHAQDNAASIPEEALTPILAVKLFMDFLAGNYYGIALTRLSQYLFAHVSKTNEQSPTLSLYKGLYEIVAMTKPFLARQNLIFSIKKVTDFAKQAPDDVLTCFVPLFYNRYFRNLFAYALTLYWESLDNLLDEETIKQFDGYQEAKELLEVLKERLSSNSSSRNDSLSELIQYVKFMYLFEKDNHNGRAKINQVEEQKQEEKTQKYRQWAFHLLDWIPVLLEKSSRQVLANVFLQIGVQFQQAALLENNPAVQMADEQLALKMYLTAIGIASHCTPDLELYVNNLVVKYLSALTYQNETLKDIIPTLKKRMLNLVDIFPFFESAKSNVAFLTQENKTLYLMRRLLKAMVDIYEYNKGHSPGIPFEHLPSTLLYQAYEACLKNWYQEEHDPALENQFRIDLMDELLFENNWIFLEVEQRLTSPSIMVNRNEKGWMKPSRSLPFTFDKFIPIYRSINGAEINYNTGAIQFYLNAWKNEDPVYEKLFNLFDLQQMLEKNIQGAIFSLDPADPDKPYHPFNQIRFSPSQLLESELLNTMLLTDYMLKFLTIGQEVQGDYPFEQRPVDSMIEHLPDYLREIIKEFQAAPHSGALHRFWIEAEALDLFVANKDQEDIVRVGLDSVKMVVKKHRMTRDIHGELKDVSNDDEGWPIYVLTIQQMQELEQGKRSISEPAMIFINTVAKLFYWENNTIIKTYCPTKDYRETLIRLYTQPREKNGKIIVNTQNMPLIYRVTTTMAQQAGMSHQYSPEFIFAYKFTTHYDEFAQYLPEFGRLRELSKISALIRFLNGIRQSNQESLDALGFLLEPSSTKRPPNSEVYRTYKKEQEKIYQNITTHFNEWRKTFSSVSLAEDRKQVHEKIHQQFPDSTMTDIALALDAADKAAITRIAEQEARKPLEQRKENDGKLYQGFCNIHLGQGEQETNLSGECLWVPASVRHEVRKDSPTGLSRYSFFVYGGVNIQPRINIVQGGNRPPGGSPVGSGAFNRKEVTRGFQDHHIVSNTNRFTKDHEAFVLAGMNINSRANKIYLPTNPSLHEKRSIHQGRHTSSYSVNVAKKLDGVVEQGKAQGWTPEQYRAETKKVLSAVRQELRAGNIGLNKNHRPWAAKW